MRSNKPKLIVIAVILISLLLCALLISSFKSGYNMKSSKNEYKSLEEIKNMSGIEVDIPKFIEDRHDLEIRDQMGQIIEIGCSDFVFKVANFIDVNADVLGLYEKSEIDIKYIAESEDTDIRYFRYRQGYPEYTNCTLVNWCTNKTSYGLMLSGKYSEQEVFELININKELFTTEENSNKVDNVVYTDVYNIDDLFTVELPKFESEISLHTVNGYTSVYIDKTLCIVFVYNNLDIDLGTFDSQSHIQVDDNLYLYYRETNPFNEGDLAYNDYNKFLSTISSVLDSIEYQN